MQAGPPVPPIAAGDADGFQSAPNSLTLRLIRLPNRGRKLAWLSVRSFPRWCARPTAARLICTCVNSRDFSQGQCAARYRSKTESLIPRQKPIVRRRLRSFNLLCQASIKRFLNAFGSTVQVAREPFTRSCSRRRLSSFAHRSAASVPGGAGSGTQPPSPPQEGRSRLPLCCHAGRHLLTPWMIRWGGARRNASGVARVCLLPKGPFGRTSQHFGLTSCDVLF